MNEHVKPPVSSDLLSKFATIVGEHYAITDPAMQEPYLQEMRDLYHGNTPMVLRPGSTAEVSAILRLANETKTAIVPQGGNTGLVGGQLPFNGEVLLSLNRMDKIREVDATSNTITAEAGVPLGRVRQAAADVDRLYPLLLPSEGTCTVGGNLSTNAGGTTAVSWGVARAQALGLEVVLADGRVLNNLNKLKKDNTGYDLKNLFIGAEGTLGVITAASLRMIARPRSVETAYVGVASPEAALELLGIASERTPAVTSFELMFRLGIDAVLKYDSGARDPLAERYEWYVLIEFSSQQREGLRETMEGILAEGVERGLVADAAMADFARPSEGVLAHPRDVRRGAAPGRRLDQARHLGAGRACAGLHPRGERGGDQADPRRAAAAVRPSRRRQHPLQHRAAGRCRQSGVPRALARREHGGIRGRAEIRRLDLGRARHRHHEARPAPHHQGPGRDGADARDQAHARSERDIESGEGSLIVIPGRPKDGARNP